MILFSSVTVVRSSAEAPPSGYIYPNGLNYAGAYWHLDAGITTDEVLNRDFSLFQANGVNLICLNLHWSYLEKSQSVYTTQYLDDVIRTCNIANQYGLSVVIDFHTLMHSNSYTIPSWVSPRSFNTVLQTTEVRQAWLNMLAYTTSYLSGVPNIHSWLMMNEPYIGKWAVQCSVDDFIQLWTEMKATIRQSSLKPVSVKFAADSILRCFNDDPRIYDLFDFISVNWFESYMSISNFENLVNHITSHGKDVAISEWGYNSNDDQVQYDKFVSYTTLFKELGVKWTLAWIWRSDSSTIDNPLTIGEGYMICRNAEGEPRQSFYAIAAANEITLPDVEPPVITSISASDLTSVSATIQWITNEPSDSTVFYGQTEASEYSVSDSYLVTEHSISLTGLSGDTSYFYRVQSTDSSGNTATSVDPDTFTTIPQSAPPQIVSSTGDSAGTTGESLAIIATITDDFGVVGADLHYLPIGGEESVISMTKIDSGDSWSSELPVDENSVGSITYYIVARDIGGNTARDPQSGTYTVMVSDNDAPVAEAGPNQTAQLGATVDFDGTASTDNIGVTSFSWDFDNLDEIQIDSTGPTTSHVYATPGTYTVTLTVSDGENTNIDTLTVTVNSGPAADVQITLSKVSSVRKSITFYKDAATVTVLSNGVPLRGASVYATWSGAYNQQVVGTSGRDGRVKFATDWVANAEGFTIMVTSVQLNGVTYVLLGGTSQSN